jgi:SAM-dependent methyltransferase
MSRLADGRRLARRVLGRARWGNLRRLEPVSRKFGYDRGTPIDRWYTDRFLAANTDALRGVVGEVADDGYTRAFGGDAVERGEVIDLDPANPRATVIADLADPGALPTRAFDCLVVTQTLQYLPDPEASLGGIARSLRPGGHLLLSVPALTPHDAKEPDAIDHWRFWPAGVESLLRRAFPGASATVHAYGNVLAATAFLQGLAAEELRPDELAHHDARYPIVVCARVDVP